MSEAEKAIVRACLEQVVLGLTESREVWTWWALLSQANREAFNDFVAAVAGYRAQLK
jgi:hypothetical protein